MSENAIVSKVWNFANVLRDDGVGYGDYLEQITYLLFLKMADELNKPPYNKGLKFPKLKNAEGVELPDAETCDWQTLSQKRGLELENFYNQMLRSLGSEKGTLGQIFVKSQNKIQDPSKLLKIIDMIDKEQWSLMGTDVKGKIYEGLLEKNAEDTKSGAGQYFTPRSLIKTMVACVRPKPMKTIIDPACGTGGFFLAAYDFIKNQELDQEEKEFLKNKTFYGNEIVANTRRMALMNMFLHNIGEIDGETLISSADALVSDNGIRYDYVLANPPFGKKSSMTITKTYFMNVVTSLAVISLSTAPANLWDDEIGIYVEGTNGIPGYCSNDPKNWNQDWERQGTIEFFEPNKTSGFQINCGIKIGGACTRLYPQKTLAIYTRSEFGDKSSTTKYFRKMISMSTIISIFAMVDKIGGDP